MSPSSVPSPHPADPDRLARPTDRQYQLARMLLDAGGAAAALTGAGVSTPSGIPDFRSPGGLWTKVNPAQVAHISVWREDPVKFWAFYRERLDIPNTYEPNPAHEALVELERRGLIQGVITQNIDGLHQKAGQQHLTEVHGSVRTCSCVCGAVFTRAEVEPLFADDGVPYCPTCDDLDAGELGPDGTTQRRALKPDVVLFGEMLPEAAVRQADTWVASSTLLLCAGSSLEVRPVADYPRMVKYDGGQVAIVSRWTTFDKQADVHLDGAIDEELAGVIRALDIIAGETETSTDDNR